MQKMAKVFGYVFLAIGVLGFVPGITSGGNLLGIFEVDAVHNIVHLLTGVLALWAASGAGTNARLFFQVFGVVYAVVTVVGFIQGSTVLGIMAVNGADNLLHLVVAAVALYYGFGRKEAAVGVAGAQG